MEVRPGDVLGRRPLRPVLDPDIRFGSDGHPLANLDADGAGKPVGQLHVDAMIEHGGAVAQSRGGLTQVRTPRHLDTLRRTQPHPADLAGSERGQCRGQQVAVVDGDLHGSGKKRPVSGIAKNQSRVDGLFHCRCTDVLGVQADSDLADGYGVPRAVRRDVDTGGGIEAVVEGTRRLTGAHSVSGQRQRCHRFSAATVLGRHGVEGRTGNQPAPAASLFVGAAQDEACVVEFGSARLRWTGRRRR